MVTYTRTGIIFGFKARRSPMSHLFLTRGFSHLLGLALVSWAFTRNDVHRHSLRLPYLMFSIRSFCHWISIVFLLYGRRIATHSVDPSLTHFLGELPGLGLALVLDVTCGPGGGTAVHMEQKTRSKFLPWPG